MRLVVEHLPLVRLKGRIAYLVVTVRLRRRTAPSSGQPELPFAQVAAQFGAIQVIRSRSVTLLTDSLKPLLLSGEKAKKTSQTS